MVTLRQTEYLGPISNPLKFYLEIVGADADGTQVHVVL
jgi:hypothetical protein